MRSLTTLIAAGLFVLCAARAEAVQEKQLVGRWRVIKLRRQGKDHVLPPSVRIEMAFKKDHSWTGLHAEKGRPRSNKTGRWTLSGDTLTTTTDGEQSRKDVLQVKVSKDTLEVSKKDGQHGLILTRLK